MRWHRAEQRSEARVVWASKSQCEQRKGERPPLPLHTRTCTRAPFPCPAGPPAAAWAPDSHLHCAPLPRPASSLLLPPTDGRVARATPAALPARRPHRAHQRRRGVPPAAAPLLPVAAAAVGGTRAHAAAAAQPGTGAAVRRGRAGGQPAAAAGPSHGPSRQPGTSAGARQTWPGVPAAAAAASATAAASERPCPLPRACC